MGVTCEELLRLDFLVNHFLDDWVTIVVDDFEGELLSKCFHAVHPPDTSFSDLPADFVLHSLNLDTVVDHDKIISMICPFQIGSLR